MSQHRRHAEPHSPRQTHSAFAGLSLEITRVDQDVPSTFSGTLPVSGQMDTPLIPIKQSQAQSSFKSLDGPGESGLGDTKFVGSPRVIETLSKYDGMMKGAQIEHIHAAYHSSPYYALDDLTAIVGKPFLLESASQLRGTRSGEGNHGNGGIAYQDLESDCAKSG